MMDGRKLAEMDPSLVRLEELLDTRWAGHPYHYQQEVDSTNAWAQRSSLEGDGHGALFVAEYQTRGKGSRGRSWEVGAGESIMTSLLLKPSFSPLKARMLTPLMGLAVADALLGMGFEVKIKWPNDVVLSSRKVCGILTEMRLCGEKIQDVVVGVGMNINSQGFPPELSDKATSLFLESGGRFFQRGPILARVIQAFEDYYQGFLRGESLLFVKEHYEGLLANLNAPVRVLDAHPYEGVARGVDPYGSLLVEREDGRVMQVSAGEVSVRGLYSYV